jgi:hypothetical protein
MIGEVGTLPQSFIIKKQNNMTTEQLLSDILWKDEAAQGTAVGTFKEVFSEFQSLLIKESKNGAARSTIMIRKDGKVSNITCSERLTNLVRAGKLGMSEIAGFPVFKSDKNKGIYVGLPSDGWLEVRSIKVKEFIPVAVTINDTIA